MVKNKFPLLIKLYQPIKRSLVFFGLSIGISLFNTSLALPTAEGIQVYQKNVHLMPEHKRRLADDITRYRNADNLWDVLREEFTLPHYEENSAVQAKIDWFMNNQDFLLRSAARAAPYLYYILQQVKKRHLPAELVLLPIIESGYNPFNRSPVGAVGIWQLMPNTATSLGIQQNSWYDGRRDVIASTRGALNYLAYLQSFFEGNWLYAIAAYNTGEGNVLTAIKRNIREGKDTSFWSLPVAQQTKDYVPSLLALAIIISHPEQYPIYLPPVQNAPYLAQIDVGREIDLQRAAWLAGISYKQILQLNPAFGTSTTPSKKGPKKLVLPIEHVEQFTENLSTSPLNRPINWQYKKIKNDKKINNTNPKISGTYALQPGDTVYMVRLKDTWESVAKRFHMNVKKLQATNHLNGKKLQAGKQLIIPTHLVGGDVATSSAAALQPGDTLYMIRKGDTVEKIAQKFNTSPAAIRLANLIDNTTLVEGEKLIVPTHLHG